MTQENTVFLGFRLQCRFSVTRIFFCTLHMSALEPTAKLSRDERRLAHSAWSTGNHKNGFYKTERVF